MSSSPRDSKFFAFALLCHLLFFLSVFEIHFKSPVIHGIEPVAIDLGGTSPPAKRIVIFIVDGLRADKWIQYMLLNPKSFISSVRLAPSSLWGISHTRIPTETRPGHVALLAGFYEDPSAIFRGWQDNPVDFDSVFNQSSSCLAWGAPDVVLMFRKGGAEKQCKFFAYDANVMDFAKQNASLADEWVFRNAKNYLTSERKLEEDGSVYLYHLLGMDLVGHNKKPPSAEYFQSLEFVDSGLREAVHLFEELHPDGETVYLMTADHGMTDWGSHGAGDPEETQTPIMVWNPNSTVACHPTCEQLVINQADVTPLVSALVGNPIPVNSIGSLPVKIVEELSTREYAARALVANVKQVIAQVDALDESYKGTMSYEILHLDGLKTDGLKLRVEGIERLIDAGETQSAIEQGEEVLAVAHKALKHNQSFGSNVLMASVLVAFVVWFGILSEEIYLSRLGRPKKRRFTRLTVGCLVQAAVTVGVLAKERATFASYVYYPLPWILLAEFFSDSEVSSQVTIDVASKCVLIAVCSIVVIGSWAASFFYRPFLMISAALLAGWPWFDPSLKSGRTDAAVKRIKIGYTLSAFALGLFALTPVVGKNAEYSMVNLGCLLSGGIFAVNLFIDSSMREKVFGAVRMLYIFSCGWTVQTTANSVAVGHGLPWFNQMYSWICLSMILPACCTCEGRERRQNIFASLCAVFILLSIRHEAVFLPVLISNAVCWIALEERLDTDDQMHLGVKKSPFIHKTPRRAAFLVAYSLLAFFGIGNVASINSFDPTSVYCFVTVFSPFVMTALMIIKIMIPIFIVTLAYAAIGDSRDEFLIVLLLGDALSLIFFCLVRSTGSWLDIGLSISQYVISMSLSVILLLLHEICAFLAGAEKSKKMHRA